MVTNKQNKAIDARCISCGVIFDCTSHNFECKNRFCICSDCTQGIFTDLTTDKEVNTVLNIPSDYYVKIILNCKRVSVNVKKKFKKLFTIMKLADVNLVDV